MRELRKELLIKSLGPLSQAELDASQRGVDLMKLGFRFIFQVASQAEFDALKARAENGEAGAQDLVGDCYPCSSGKYVSQDFAEALLWKMKAAEQDYRDALSWLGYAYQHGWGVPKNSETAVEWFAKAAERGDSFAAEHVAEIFYKGDGVPRDYTKALEWHLKSYEKYLGHDAAYRIGLMHHRGEGVLKDYVTAYFWMNIGSADGHEKAREFLEVLETEMVPEQIAKAQELGREHLRELKDRLESERRGQTLR